MQKVITIILICDSTFIFISLLSCIVVGKYVNAQSPTNNSIDVSGTFLSDKGSVYYIKQVNDTVWILGTADPVVNDKQSTIASIFSGTVDNDIKRISGKWIGNYPLSNNTQNGNANFDLLIGNSNKNITITRMPSTVESPDVVYPAHTLTKYDPSLHSPLTIYVTMENILVNIPRSPTADILYVGMSGQKNKDDPITATKYFGPIGDVSNITTDLRIGPFLLDDENDSLKVKILGLDREDEPISFTLISLRNTLIQLMKPSNNISDLVQASTVISSISPGLIPRGCGGLVFMDELEFPYSSLRNLTITGVNGEHIQEKTYDGTSSPPGCGAPSQYEIKLSINDHR